MALRHRGEHGDNFGVQCGSAVRKKPRFTHVRANLRGDVCGKRFSAHVGERHINKDTPDDFSSGVSEERQLPTLPPGLAVPSAMTGLASLFGMGRGGSPSL